MPGPSDDPGGEPRPGDRALTGTPGTEEVVCQECEGKGELMGKPCLACNGTGMVIGRPGSDDPLPMG